MTRLALAALTRELLARARAGRSPAQALGELAPALRDEIVRASRVRAALALWSRSRNVDELVGRAIVEPEILAGIAAVSGVAMSGAAVHAGLQHTYAYLLSNRRTPYGMKRTRWVAPQLERGLGLRPRALRPLPRGGTLLTNLTFFLGMVALRGAQRARLRLLAAHVAPQLLTYPFARLRVQRRTETVTVQGRSVQLVTDLVQLERLPRGPHSLLIYSVRDGHTPQKLVTAFPVDAATVRALRALPAGRAEIRARFNAHVRGWRGPRRGRRSAFVAVSARELAPSVGG